MHKRASQRLSSDIVSAARVIAHRMSGGQTAAASLSPSVRDLVYRGSRAWGLAQVRAARLAAKNPPDGELLALLAIAWAAMDQELRPVHVVVDESVAATKKLFAGRRGAKPAEKIAGFVNAMLRKTLADPIAATEDHRQPMARFNAPAWWIDRVTQDYGQQAPAVLDALAARAPLTLRLCDAVMSMKDYLANLSEHGIRGYPVGPRAVVIDPPLPVERIPGFLQGLVSVQDSAAQHVVEIFRDLGLRLGRRPVILDACAAPGGKAFAMIQSTDCEVWAIDVSAARLNRLQRDLPRVGQHALGRVEMCVLDVLDEAAWQDSGLPAAFDAIVLDAPCTASGITRRQPEIAWRRQPSDLFDVVDIQRKMLDILWRRLAPGGELLFVTCSVFAQEGEAQQQAFLERTPNARLLSSPGRLLPVSGITGGCDQDGFFYARFGKIEHANHGAGAGALDTGPGHRGGCR
ncbi:MAG: methyltransferase domain-containing protein [Burkholderiaceae bacterium]|nr:methyltransferase domain-containing protein [Burkholderiaceae bacterium]